MSENTTISTGQLRNREIVAADLLHTIEANPDARRTALTVPSEPLSVFGRKMAGHEG
ncbi:hypothetical protein [Arthrobacter sp. UYCo732]|uniref:hypothetical protein n=1 Tax=Arthrobacter sp. UYCo732 TaxID=3156336 RepID=UPI003398C338